VSKVDKGTNVKVANPHHDYYLHIGRVIEEEKIYKGFTISKVIFKSDAVWYSDKDLEKVV
jgi:hypothetical protein